MEKVKLFRPVRRELLKNCLLWMVRSNSLKLNHVCHARIETRLYMLLVNVSGFTLHFQSFVEIRWLEKMWQAKGVRCDDGTTSGDFTREIFQEDFSFQQGKVAEILEPSVRYDETVTHLPQLDD